jgi:hypothetical protein
MMSPRTNHRLPCRIVNTPTVPGIRDHYHRPVSRKSGQGAVSIDQSRITIDYQEVLALMDTQKIPAVFLAPCTPFYRSPDPGGLLHA